MNAILLPVTLAVLALGFAIPCARAAEPTPLGVSDFSLATADGGMLKLADLHGKVVLLVNTASQCGFTPQYEGLQRLYAAHQERGLVVVAVPSNDFGSQEPGTNEQIQQFCTSRFSVTFPVVAKQPVKGPKAHPLYAWLTTSSPFPGPIGWNFTKFLIARDGTVAARFDSRTTPDNPALVKALLLELAKPAP
jgi:glutathione peroxidase